MKDQNSESNSAGKSSQIQIMIFEETYTYSGFL